MVKGASSNLKSPAGCCGEFWLGLGNRRGALVREGLDRLRERKRAGKNTLGGKGHGWRDRTAQGIMVGTNTCR